MLVVQDRIPVCSVILRVPEVSAFPLPSGWTKTNVAHVRTCFSRMCFINSSINDWLNDRSSDGPVISSESRFHRHSTPVRHPTSAAFSDRNPGTLLPVGHVCRFCKIYVLLLLSLLFFQTEDKTRPFIIIPAW